jgi:hypothetical protein
MIETVRQVPTEQGEREKEREEEEEEEEEEKEKKRRRKKEKGGLEILVHCNVARLADDEGSFLSWFFFEKNQRRGSGPTVVPFHFSIRQWRITPRTRHAQVLQ